jgi:exodeoxyribonuclease VII small subunit
MNLLISLQSSNPGNPHLEESLELWERGEVLAKICQEWLDGAKAKLDAVKSEKKSASRECLSSSTKISYRSVKIRRNIVSSRTEGVSTFTAEGYGIPDRYP